MIPLQFLRTIVHQMPNVSAQIRDFYAILLSRRLFLSLQLPIQLMLLKNHENHPLPFPLALIVCNISHAFNSAWHCSLQRSSGSQKARRPTLLNSCRYLNFSFVEGSRTSACSPSWLIDLYPLPYPPASNYCNFSFAKASSPSASSLS